MCSSDLQRALFRHMAHQHNAHAGGFGRAREVRSAFAHLRTEPGAEVSWSEYTVWIESITAPPGSVAAGGHCRGGDRLFADGA